MQISTRGQYGLRALVDLAINASSGPIPLSSIAGRQSLSLGYLEQVFSSLRKAGLVRSVKGAQGGYILADSQAKITVGDVLRALEGDLNVVDDKDKDETSETIIEQCLRTMVWERINEALSELADSITLEDLAIESRKLNESLVNMYYI
ncbi:MAG: Rrf2 family transcriptional regulator [Clostridiales bacterium]|nr:Rrf2 family transcriptional regulator [Clostridiales bacterium]